MSPKVAPSSQAKTWLGGAVFIGAMLPLALGLLLNAVTGSAQGEPNEKTTGADTKVGSAPVRGIAKLEPGEDKPGGDATSRGSTNNANAFSNASGNMGFRNELNFKIGNSTFRRAWVSAPSSTDASDGLGPLFNVRGCQNCHLKDGRGAPPNVADLPGHSGSMLFRLSVPPKTDADKALLASGKVAALPDPVYGGQLQDSSIQGFAPEAKVNIAYEEKEVELGGGEKASLRVPTYTFTDLGYGPMSEDIQVSPRVAPPMIGLGLLEAIPEAHILANADPDDENGDGISGKASRVWSLIQDKETLGRFGWKAGQPDIAEQSAAAFSGDIGISTTLHPSGAGDCTEKQVKCIDAPSGNSPKYQNVEIGDELFDLVTFYSQNLAVPKRRKPDDPEVLKGKALFHEVGCAGCHKPSFVTGDLPGQKHLSNQHIWPYTDMLLHDMGEGLTDNRPVGSASDREWRTAPLWGIGLTETVNGHTLFLHDGRARNLTEAVLWHGGEAQQARDKFAVLSKEDRARLLAFVNSL